MANLPETEDFAAGTYQIETSDRVLGGPGGIANKQAEQLGNRTAWLRAAIAKIINGTTAVGAATRLSAARILKFKGAVVGSGSYDGSADTEITLTLADTGVAAGTYTKVTISVKGLVTGAANPTTLNGFGITDAYTIQQVDAALLGKAAKATTLGGYGVTDALSSTPQGVLTGAIADIAKHDIGTYAGPTTDKPTAGGIYLRLKYPGATPLAFDLYAHMASGADTFGFRRVGSDGTSTWREVYHSGNFDPATKMPITGGLYSPAFSSLRVVDSSAIGSPGSHLSYGTDGQLTNCFNSVCNKGTGTGGFTWRTVNATNSVTGPTMSYTAEGILTVPTGLWVPALTANTTVLTQAEGYTGQYAASCAFVATAVGRKVSSDRLVTAGFYSGAKTAPYFVHNDGSVVYLQVDRPKDTALLTANGWSKNADTGEITQRAEVAIGDSVGSMQVSVTWPFKFPTKCLKADYSLRVANGSPIAIIAGFYDITDTGATVKFEELNSAVQSGLVLMVEAVGY